MKLLILDDNEAKAQAVQKVLTQAYPAAGIEFIHAQCFVSGIRALKEHVIDLLLLDLVLPMRKGQQPSAQAGKVILDEIVDAQVNIPSHIICLTAFESESSILQSDVQKSLVHLVIYDDISDDWKGRLLTKVGMITRRLAQASAGPMQNGRADVVIITSSPLVELKEVTKLPGGFVAEYDRWDKIHYYHAEWDCVGAKSKSIVACAAPAMGMTAACVTACKAIATWRPTFLIMTGIAASTVATQKQGDVLCVETAYDYGSGKIQEDEDGKKVFIPSPQQLQLDTKVHEILKHWEREQIGMKEIQAAWYAPSSRTPSLIVGVMASGAAVVQSQEMVEDIKSTSRKTVGLDMEAYAIFQSCALAGGPGPIAIVAKGISDHANSGKTDDGQQYAAFASAQFVFQLCTKCPELWL